MCLCEDGVLCYQVPTELVLLKFYLARQKFFGNRNYYSFRGIKIDPIFRPIEYPTKDFIAQAVLKQFYYKHCDSRIKNNETSFSDTRNEI